MRYIEGNIVFQSATPDNQEAMIQRYTDCGWGFEGVRGDMDKVTLLMFTGLPGQLPELPDTSDLE